jgi:sporulation protein YlmC with PRC-barrel domain
MMHVKLDELRGRKVFDANGRAIGRVNAALVDMETWAVDTLQIRVGRQAAADLDMPWSLWSFFRPPTVNVGTGQINAAADAIILRISLAELREAAPHLIGGEEVAAVH